MRHKRTYLKIIAQSSLFVVMIGLSACTEDNTPIPSVYDNVSLELNNGEKWDVSDNMIQHMNNSFDLIDEATGESEKDYEALAKDLVEQKTAFVSSCDMKGEGHDVLHAWLMPYIGLLEDLDKATTLDDQERILGDIENARTIFLEYFQ